MLREAERLAAGLPEAATFDYIIVHSFKSTDKLDFEQSSHDATFDMQQPRA